MSDITQIAMAIFVGIAGAESSWGKDPRAWERGRHGAGPLQVTRICCEDYNRRKRHVGQEDAALTWPDAFLGSEAWENSEAVYLDHCNHYGRALQERYGTVPTGWELPLIWRYGYAGCVRENWSDPEGYWAKVAARRKRPEAGKGGAR